MADVSARLLVGRDLYTQVVQERMLSARTSLWIGTANVKAMMVERAGGFVPVVEAFAELASRGVDIRLLHADRPSRPFMEALRKQARVLNGRMEMRVCPRVHFKLVLVDQQWVYAGSANLTGAGLGAKDEHRRNFEMGFGSTDAELLDHAAALFMGVWSGAECAQCRLRSVCPRPLGPAAEGAPRRRRKSRDGAGEGLVQLGRARKMPRAR